VGIFWGVALNPKDLLVTVGNECRVAPKKRLELVLLCFVSLTDLELSSPDYRERGANIPVEERDGR